MELNAKMQINVEPDKAYEAFVDPAKLEDFGFHQAQNVGKRENDSVTIQRI